MFERSRFHNNETCDGFAVRTGTRVFGHISSSVNQLQAYIVWSKYLSRMLLYLLNAVLNTLGLRHLVKQMICIKVVGRNCCLDGLPWT